MKDGYYWVSFEGDEPEIIRTEDGCMYRCGTDVVGFMRNGTWEFMGDEINIVVLSGQLSAPCK